MTQSDSSTMLDDKRESDDKPTSNEIRADIDNTRTSVGEKIDQLQARLDPNRLMQQAQETVQEMLTDTANSMTEYVRAHRDEMVGSLADAARRNPLPTALVGLGVGWLILETMAGNKRHDDDGLEYERRSVSSRSTGRSTGRSHSEYGRGENMDDDTFNQPNHSSPGYASYGNGTSYGNGHQQASNPLAKAADAVKDTVGDVGSGIKERVEDVGQEIKDRVGDVKDRIGEAVGDVRQQAGLMSGQTQHSLQQAGNQMDQWQSRARDEGQRRGQQVMRNLEDNPLAYGALALAAGAALAIFLPQTRTENRVFGEMRDQVMEKGQEAVESAKSHAQQVVSEIRPELEEKARQIVSDVKEIGKEVVKDAADELRPVVDKAVSKTKEEAHSAAQELGVNPDKLTGSSSPSGSSTGSSSMGSSSMGSSSSGGKPTNGAATSSPSMGSMSTSGTSSGGTPVADKSQGNKPAINRDTMRGQWKQLQGEVKSQWGQLTDDELTRVEGDYEKLVGVIQTRYGYARGRAEQEINDFFNSRKA